MASIEFKNNVKSTIVDSSLAAGATTLNVATGEGANFPSSVPFLITIWNAVTYPNPGDDSGMEVVKCTARTTDALTIVRAQEDTADVEHANGERVAMLMTAGHFNDATIGIVTKLDTIETDAKDDQTGSEIIALINAGADLIDDNNIALTIARNNTNFNIGLHKIYQGAAEYIDFSNNGYIDYYAANDHRFHADVIPSDDGVYMLGISPLKWAQIYSKSLVVTEFVKHTNVASAPSAVLGSMYCLNNKLYCVDDGGEKAIVQVASEVTNTPAGDIVATDIQAAINELDTEKAPTDSPIFLNHVRKSARTNITAYAGGGQTNAVLLERDLNMVTVCATGGDSVKLPNAAWGRSIIIGNRGAASLNIFPASGSYINDVEDGSVAIASDATALAYCYTNLFWEVVELTRA